MSDATVWSFLALFALGIAFKLMDAPRRQRWLTLVGFIDRDAQPRTVAARMTGGAGLLVVAVLALLFPTMWEPTLSAL